VVEGPLLVGAVVQARAEEQGRDRRKCRAKRRVFEVAHRLVRVSESDLVAPASAAARRSREHPQSRRDATKDVAEMLCSADKLTVSGPLEPRRGLTVPSEGSVAPCQFTQTQPSADLRILGRTALPSLASVVSNWHRKPTYCISETRQRREANRGSRPRRLTSQENARMTL